MPATAEKKDPALWDAVKQKVTQGDKGGKPGQWSARKAQLAVHDYKEEGGTYRGQKSGENHLTQWTEEDWGTKSGQESAKTGERYLPRKARESLSPEDYSATTRKKRADTKKGHQFSKQPPAVARQTAVARHDAGQPQTRADLLALARKRGLKNVSRRRKADLMAALQHDAG